MYKLLIIPLTLISFTSISQITWNCYTEDEYGNTVKIDCDGHIPTPVFTGNIDSLCWEMEKRFVNTLNEWRRNHGIHELEYDDDMESLLTVPHNEWQVNKGLIAHGEDGRSLSEISRSRGFTGVGECVAYNYRSDMGEVSQFYIQYKKSKLHFCFCPIRPRKKSILFYSKCSLVSCFIKE
jgi:uncharacterized protein YkwD